MNNELGRLWEEAAVAWLKLLSQHFLEELNKGTKNLSQDSRFLGTRFQSGTSWIQTGSANHSTTTFGYAFYSFTIHFNIILPYKPRSRKWLFFSKL
jgi:hypothetical protein